MPFVAFPLTDVTLLASPPPSAPVPIAPRLHHKPKHSAPLVPKRPRSRPLNGQARPLWWHHFTHYLQEHAVPAPPPSEVAAFLGALNLGFAEPTTAQKQNRETCHDCFDQATPPREAESVSARLSSRAHRASRLTPSEREALVAHLAGTHRLIAQLLIETNLPLGELLRLRVNQFDSKARGLKDFSRKVQPTKRIPLSAITCSRLDQHLQKIRTLFRGDRAINLPGVTLPQRITTHLAKSGQKWAWQWLFPNPASTLSTDRNRRSRAPLPANAFAAALHAAAQAAGIKKSVPLLVFRQTLP